MTEEKNKLNLYAYCRVSTSRQKDKETIKQQIHKIEKYEDYHDGKYNIVKMYEDDGISGFKSGDARPGYDQMIKDLLSNDNIDGILATTLSRLSRSSTELNNLADLLRKNKKELVTIKENIDTTTPVGRAFYGMLAVFIQFDAESIIEKLASGRQYAKEVKGVKFGRKKKIVPEHIRRKMISWYSGKQQLGYLQIKKLLKFEKHMGMDEKGIEVEIIGFEMSTATIGKKLKEWNVEIRPPKHRNSGKRIDYESINKEIK